ncbi:MAG: hypothetical protein U1F87_08065 [Kiritimatiellia bacterium]
MKRDCRPPGARKLPFDNRPRSPANRAYQGTLAEDLSAKRSLLIATLLLSAPFAKRPPRAVERDSQVLG